jgi:hypothetical protein
MSWSYYLAFCYKETPSSRFCLFTLPQQSLQSYIPRRFIVHNSFLALVLPFFNYCHHLVSLHDTFRLPIGAIAGSQLVCPSRGVLLGAEYGFNVEELAERG